jgi:hypothetical protein
MTSVALKPQLAPDVTEAAKLIGKRGGRPKGSCSSPLAQWLRAEARQRRAEGYRCREAFDILRDTEGEDGRDALTILDWTADEHYLEPGARVTWSYFRKIWADLGNRNRFP